MEIRLASLLQGAQEAAGTTIITDIEQVHKEEKPFTLG